LIASDIEFEISKALPKRGEFRSNIGTRHGADRFFQDFSNFGLGATPMLDGTQLERTMRFFWQVANRDGRHVISPLYTSM
jgi:hypothetical protein